MQLRRTIRHLLLPRWWVLRDFPKTTLDAIERAIDTSEASHRGQLRLVIEANLPLSGVLQGQTPRERAVELFSELRVWDTEHNSGVLIYLQLIDHRVEIVADRGIDAKVGHEFWRAVCQRMEVAFSKGDFESGVLAALAEITEALTGYFPSADELPNELPDFPLVL